MNVGDGASIYVRIAALNIFQYGDKLQMKDIVHAMIHKVEINVWISHKQFI